MSGNLLGFRFRVSARVFGAFLGAVVGLLCTAAVFWASQP